MPQGGESAGTAKASMARVNNALLGGKDNFRVDRDVRDDPARMIAAYVDAMPSGSYLIFGAMMHPGPGQELADFAVEMIETYRLPGNGGWLRTREELLAMLSGVELIEPGLVVQGDWWPDGPRQRPPGRTQRLVVGAVGRKPRLSITDVHTGHKPGFRCRSPSPGKGLSRWAPRALDKAGHDRPHSVTPAPPKTC